MKVDIVTNNKKLCAVIYEYEKGFIATEKYSSMGFNTHAGALQWICGVCKGEEFSKENDCYKMMPDHVKAEVKKQLTEI